MTEKTLNVVVDSDWGPIVAEHHGRGLRVTAAPEWAKGAIVSPDGDRWRIHYAVAVEDATRYQSANEALAGIKLLCDDGNTLDAKDDAVIFEHIIACLMSRPPTDMREHCAEVSQATGNDMNDCLLFLTQMLCRNTLPTAVAAQWSAVTPGTVRGVSRIGETLVWWWVRGNGSHWTDQPPHWW